MNIFFFVCFYLNLTSAIITRDLTPIIFSALIYICASILQLRIVPEPHFYKSRIEFDENMKKLFNLTLSLKFSSYSDNNKTEYPIKYINDITGTINIPNDIKFVKIQKFQLFFDEDFDKFNEKYEDLHGNNYLIITSYYNDILIDDKSLYGTYNLNSNSSTYTINFGRTIICLFLLQWIFAIYDKNKSTKCIVFSPAKLISTKKFNSTTNIYIHEKPFKFNKNIFMNIKSNDADKIIEIYDEKMKLQRKKESEIEEKKRKERIKFERELAEKRRKLEENTEILSVFKDENNFEITVKRIYDKVEIEMKIYTSDGQKYEYINAGEYEPEAEEYEEDDGNSSIFYPRGKDIKIQVTYFDRKYIIKVGTIFTNSYYYFN